MKRILLLFTLGMISGSSAFAQYCSTAFSSGCTFGDDINSVTVGNFSHLNTGCSTGAYGNFTAAAGVDTIQLNQALSYGFSVSTNFSSSEYAAIYIDFNADQDFADAGEAVFVGTTPFGSAAPQTGTITIPTGLTNGFTRMRVIVNYAGAVSGPCLSSTFGETHDYTVQILPAPTCLPVTALAAGNITPTTADITWTSTTNNYDVEYGLAGFTQGTGTTITGILVNNYTVPGLTSNTNYDAYVRANCGGGDFSPWVKVSFKTACSYFVTPFTEDFATTPTGNSINNTVPTCWTYYETAGHPGGGYVTAFSNPRSVPNQYQFTNSSNTVDSMMLISPLIQGLDSSTKQITFWAKSNTTSYTCPLVIGTIGDITNPAGTFTAIDTVVAPQNFVEFIILFNGANGYNGTDEHIAILYKNTQGTFRSVFIDDISVENIPACPKPTFLTASNFTGTTALLGWTNGATDFDIQWGPCGFSQATGGTIVSNITSNSYTLTGLAGNTCYDFYVRADCGVDGNSVWNGPFSFTTAIIPVWLENFDAGYNPTSTVTPIPARWREAQGLAANPTIVTSTFSSWNQDGFLNNGFIGATRLSIFNTSTTIRDWMVTPPIDLSNGPWQFYFDAGITSSGGTGSATMGVDDTIMVIVSTDYGQTWNRSNAVAKFHNGSGISNTATTLTADLSAYTGQTVVIGVYGESTVSNSPLPSYDFHIDNLGVRVPPACASPLSGQVTGVTSSSADLSWVAGPSNVTYNIEWGPCGFVQGTGTFVNGVAATSTTVTGLSPATCYDFYIQADCGSGNGQSAWIGPFTATTLCLPIAAPVIENFDGSTWVVGTGFNNIGSLIDQCWDRNSESLTSDYTWGPRALVTGLGTTTGPSGDHTTGSSNFIYTESSVGTSPGVATLESPQINLATLTNPEMRFWYHMYGSGIGKLVVSLDTGNGGFFKVDSLVGQQQSGKTAAWKEFLVSLIPHAGKTIQVRWEATKINTLGDFAIDDFSVISGPTCPQPTQLTAGNLTGFTADLSWVSNGNDFSIEWGPQGFTPVTGSGTKVFGVATNSYALTGLTPITCYDYYVRSVCSGTDSSLLSGPFTFCTPCAPYTAPYSQNFDALAINLGAPCFGVAYTGVPSTLPYQQVRTNQFNITPITTPNVLQLYSGNNSASTVVWVSPEFSDLDSNNRWVTFSAVSNYFSLGTIPVSLAVGSMSNPSDPASFTAEDTITFTTQYQWENAFVLLNNVPSGNKHIGLRLITTATFTSIYLDNFVYEKVPSCPNPYQVVTTGATTSSISLTWTSNSTAANSIIRATPTQGGTVVTAVVPNTGSGTIGGLTDATEYAIAVADICGPGDTSVYSFPAIQATKCLPVNMIYLQDFETWSTGPAPLCWEDQGTVPWAPAPGNGGTVAEAQFWSFSSGTMVMNTPLININQKAILRFEWSRNASTFYDDKLYVRGRVAGAATWDTLKVYQGTTFSTPGAGNTTPAPVFNKDTIVLDTNWVGSNVEIQFYGVTDFGPDLFIDNVIVEPDPAFLSCPNPIGLASSGVTSNSAVVSYNGGGGTYQISYGINLNNPALGTIVAGTGGVDTLTGLTPASNYCFFVREICAPGDTSFWSIASCFQTACVPYTLPYVEDFQAWAIGSTEPLCFSSAGGTQKWDRYDAAGNIVARANFWSFTSGNTFILQSPQIIMNTSAELRFKWSHLYSSFYPDDEVTIYGRAVGATQWDTLISLVGAAFNSNDGAGNTTPGSFIWDTVALNPAWVGQTIELQLFANSGFGPSAFLDSVSVISTSTCPAPSSLASANVVCDAFDVTFTSASGTSYAEYGATGFTPGAGTVVSPATSPLTISGLTPGTSYDVYVYDICGTDTSSAGILQGVTTATGPKPVAAFTYNVYPGATDAVVGFDASSSTGGTTYAWDYGTAGTGTGVSDSATYTANGTYTVTLVVTNACGSDTATQQVVVTGIGMGEIALANSFEVFPNPAKGKVSVAFNLLYANAATVEILDLTGRVIWSESAQVNGTYRSDIDLSNMATGVYLVRVNSADGVATKRLIVE